MAAADVESGPHGYQLVNRGSPHSSVKKSPPASFEEKNVPLLRIPKTVFEPKPSQQMAIRLCHMINQLEAW